MAKKWNEYEFQEFNSKEFEDRLNEVMSLPLEPELIEICKALSKS